MLKEEILGVIERVKDPHLNQVKETRKRIRIPKIETFPWLTAARRVRILSSFPEIVDCGDLNDFRFSKTELTAVEWLMLEPGSISDTGGIPNFNIGIIITRIIHHVRR